MIRILTLIGMLSTALVGVSSPASAASPVQTCSGPALSTQAGRATFSPGLNGFAVRPTVDAKVNLTRCSPSAATGGTGTLKFTLKTLTTKTCTFITEAHAVRTSATISWANSTSSTLTLTISFTGSTRLANVTGSVASGLFAGHSVSGQYHYKPVVSPSNFTVAQACANTVPPGHSGRISIVGLILSRAKAFTIT